MSQCACVVMAGSLFESDDLKVWRAALSNYPRLLELKAAKRGKKSSKPDDLMQLDRWYQNTLPEIVSERKDPHFTHEELGRVMKWKLMRGKFRPRLSELVLQNKPEEVEKVTREAIKLLPNLETAIKHLTQLKGIGPATASAVLCAAAPEVAPFMADEAVLEVPGLGKLEYNLKHYMKYARRVEEKKRTLNALETSANTKPWTCHDVELALWTFNVANKLEVELTDTSPSPASSLATAATATSSEAGDNGRPTAPKAKKRKLAT